jgi:hypothetical protein
MAIFRGIGGAGSGDNDATVTAVTTKATEAAASATAASSSASSAATSATASANSATTSSTKASEASASNDTATTKAGEASTSATAAANSATASANSATAAASSATDAANAVPQPELAATGSPTFAAITINGNIIATGTVDGRDLQTDGTKLDAIEANADVTDATNVAAAGALMESELADIAAVKATTGTFLVADQTKLDGIEAGATADQTNDEIRAAVEAATDSNIFTDADHTKLDGIEASADVTDATNVAAAGALMESELADIAAVKATTGTFLTADQTKLDDIEAGATADQTAAEVVNTPAGSIVATDVQAAINELDGGDAGTATNLAGGLGGSVPYQTGAGATSMLANGTAGQVSQSNGTTAAPSWIDNAYDISFGIAGAPPASQVYQITMVRAVDLAAEFAGSDGDVITVPSTGAIEIDVHKNGTTIGDIQISTGGALTFNSDEPSVTSFAAGDRLGLVMPADLDNCEDLNIVFKGVLV